MSTDAGIEGTEAPPANADIQRMRKLADENPGLKKELEQTQRELAFVKAGISTDDPKLTYFVKGYDGPIEVDAIRAAAVEAGFIQQQQADPAVAQAQAGQQAVQAAAAGAPSVGNGASVIAGLRQAHAEGGRDAMIAYGHQFGLKVTEP